MASDISRNTFDPDRRYTSVRQQQGRVQVDADWNEQADVTTHLRRAAIGAVVGPSGAPKDGGYAIAPDGAGDLTISAGVMYVDGIRCVSAPGQTYATQPDHPTAEPLAGATAGRYAVHLDVWERDVTSLQDPDLAEPALGGPDTTTRRRTVAQVRLAAVAAGATCDDVQAGWAPVAAPTGTMRVASTTGFRGLENQLYRVVVHDGSDTGAPTFKFSRDNASVRFAIESVSGRTVTLRDLGPDDVRTLEPGDWVELLDDHAVLDGAPTQLFPVGSVDRATREVVLDGTDAVPVYPAALAAERHAFVQRWDHVEREVPLVGGARPLDTTSDTELEDGVTVRFGAGSFRSGDHWLVATRGATGTILWPTVGGAPSDLAPHGVAHHVAALALVDFDGTDWTLVSDCRPIFPSLTEIEATDVSYDPTNCVLVTATTVQEAIDQLCGQIRDGCTVNIGSGADVAAAIAAFNASDVRDAKICFQDGEYTTTTRLDIVGKRHILVEGFGEATRLRALQLETFLRFESCASVTVRDVRVEAGRATRATEHLSGALTFDGCGSVRVDGVTAVTAHGNERAAAAITVAADRGVDDVVRVTNCNLEVGNQQIGLLVTDSATVTVRDNRIRARPLPSRQNLRTLVEGRRYRAAVRRTFLAPPTSDTGGNPPGGRSIAIVRGDQTLSIRSTSRVATLWQPFVDALRLDAPTSDGLMRELNAAVDRVILADGVVGIAGFERFRDWFRALDRQNVAMMSQGVVIGGRRADDVRVVDNRIDGAAQGVHIGVSRRESRRGVPESAGTVVVNGNTVNVTVTPIVLRRPEGIFVGNVDSGIIDHNRVIVTRTVDASSVTMDGITCHGHFGQRLVIRNNDIDRATNGVRVVPLNSVSPRRWLVADNVATGASAALVAPVSVDAFGNMPGGTTYRDLEILARS